jgi:hypothetical protein
MSRRQALDNLKLLQHLPRMRKYDILAISLLIFSVILVTAISIDPKGFSLQEWQPIMAAVLALGGAGIIYRGATLAYNAAMSRLDFDREINHRDSRRKARGILLRASFGAHVIGNDTKDFAEQLSDPPLYGGEKIINAGMIKLRAVSEIDGVWNNLDLFPPKITNPINNLRIAIFNIEEACQRLGSADLKISRSSLPPPALVDLRRGLKNAVEFCNQFLQAHQEIGDDFAF